jgi:hypothetical protein
VVNCGTANDYPNIFAKEKDKEKLNPTVAYATVNTDDSNAKASPPRNEWRRAMKFLTEAKRKGQSTLVHCIQGQNRSVTTVAIFLVRENGPQVFGKGQSLYLLLMFFRQVLQDLFRDPEREDQNIPKDDVREELDAAVAYIQARHEGADPIPRYRKCGPGDGCDDAGGKEVGISFLRFLPGCQVGGGLHQGGARQAHGTMRAEAASGSVPRVSRGEGASPGSGWSLPVTHRPSSCRAAGEAWSQW